MDFNLVSDYKPTGDQPEAISGLTASLLKGNPHQTLLGVTGSGKTFTIANVIANLNRPTLVISHNKTLAAQLYQEFRDYFPQNAVSYFVSYYDYYQPEAYLPSTDTYIAKETDINDEIDKLRLAATANLLSRPDVIVVASVSCIYNIGSPVVYGQNQLEIMIGELIDRATLTSCLIDIQYQNSEVELKRGSFRLRGDSLTVWPANQNQALKIVFLDNLIESITVIDPLTGDPIVSADSPPPTHFTIYPAKHFQGATGSSAVAITQIKADLKARLNELKDQGKTVEAYRLAQKVKYDLQMIEELGYVNGIENYSRYFDGRKPGDPPYTLLDYLQYNRRKFNRPGFLTVIDESHITLPQLRGMYFGDRSRKQVLIDFGFRLPSALDNRPLTYSEALDRLPQILYSSATPGDTETSASHGKVFEQVIRPTGLIEPSITIRPISGQIPDLIKEILIRCQKHERVLVTTLTKKTAEALTQYLNEPDKISSVVPGPANTLKPKVQYLHADVNTLDRQDILDSLRTGDFDVVIGINLLREGLDLPEVSLVAILEADKEGFLRSKTSLIQTMGRAARHLHGQVILYADQTTPSMAAAISEINRRRQIQITYNEKHQITPQGIRKPVRDKLIKRDLEKNSAGAHLPPEITAFGVASLNEIESQNFTPDDRQKLIKVLTRLMRQSAKNWDFELAARYRDLIVMLKSA